MNRRSLLLGAGSLILAPAIVRAESLMPIFPVWTKTIMVDTERFNSLANFWIKFSGGSWEPCQDALARMYLGDLKQGETLDSVPRLLLGGHEGPAIIQFPHRKVYAAGYVARNNWDGQIVCYDGVSTYREENGRKLYPTADGGWV